MTNDWKARLGMVYSTDPNFKYDTEEAPQTETLAPERQDLRVWLDRKQRVFPLRLALRTRKSLPDSMRT